MRVPKGKKSTCQDEAAAPQFLFQNRGKSITNFQNFNKQLKAVFYLMKGHKAVELNRLL